MRLKPKVMCWIYTMVVRPMLTYAATVWCPRFNFKASKVELSKLQKMACFGIIVIMKTAPTAAIAVLIGLCPLHLQLEAVARAGIYRLYCSDCRSQ
jgi:hypothetical protein